jgi:2-polyprenyl-6-methoxyphenol hydroxylase-like FAD-dependent oxidoreductase
MPHALVIGGSLSGLFAASLLRTIGWDVSVFERSSGNMTGRGAGLGAQEALFAVMRRIGIAFDDSMWVAARSHVCLDRDGNIICDVPVHQLSTAWDRLFQALKAALPQGHYHSGMLFERCEQTDGSVTAIFADGTQIEADLLIGADGMNSTVRHLMMPDLLPEYAGYVAWRGVVDETDVPVSLRELAFNHMVFCFPSGEMAFSVPMAKFAQGERVYNRRCMFAWFRPVELERTLPQLCTDATGHRHGVSIPPPLIRSEIIDDLRNAGEALLAPQINTLLGAVRQPILSPIFDLESPRLVFGRVLLLGDSAFAVRPHVGTGVTKAALDAQALTDALAQAGDNVDEALARYDSERIRFGHWLVARGRYLGAHLGTSLSHQRQACVHARPQQSMEGYLREYGAGGVIKGESISSRCP